MTLIFRERLGQGGRRIGPFAWRISYVFTHKALKPEVMPMRFAEVDRMSGLSDQQLVPIIGRSSIRLLAIRLHSLPLSRPDARTSQRFARARRNWGACLDVCAHSVTVISSTCRSSPTRTPTDRSGQSRDAMMGALP